MGLTDHQKDCLKYEIRLKKERISTFESSIKSMRRGIIRLEEIINSDDTEAYNKWIKEGK